MTPRISRLVLAIGLTLTARDASARDFVYRGELAEDGRPAAGRYDFRVTPYASADGGAPIAPPIVLEDVVVADGRFAAAIDLELPGNEAWLEVAVRGGDEAGGFETLAVRAKADTGTSCPASWATTGNAALTGSNFLGTTDAAPLQLRANNERVWLGTVGSVLLEGSAVTATSVNVVAGHAANAVTPSVTGATIAGGGGTYAGGGSPGPRANLVTDLWGTIGGGRDNLAGDDSGTVGDASVATVGGGASNEARGPGATVAGGAVNVARGDFATVAGGNGNVASTRSFVGGGTDNTMTADHNVIGGGEVNFAGGGHATVGGGSGNRASGARATVGGGALNVASGNGASVVGGGVGNVAVGGTSTVAGGSGNTASGQFSAVPGGYSNQAGGEGSFAAGTNANVRTASEVNTAQPAANDEDGDEGTFAWSDASTKFQPFASSGPNQFLVKANGGFGINTARKPGNLLPIDSELTITSNTARADTNVDIAMYPRNGTHGYSVGVAGTNADDTVFFVSKNDGVGFNTRFLIEADGTTRNASGAWATLSDLRLKRDVAPIESALARVLALRGVSFEYNEQAGDLAYAGRRYGFIAQEVEAVFPQWVDTDARGYRELELVGFEAVAVEALRELEAAHRVETGALREENAALRAALGAIERRLARLERGGRR